MLRLGVGAIAATLEEITDYGADRAGRLLRDAGLAVSTLTHRAFGFATAEIAEIARQRLNNTIAAAQAITAETITFTTGPANGLVGHEAVERFASEIAPCALRASEAGTRLSLEPTSHLYADVSIAHRLSDAVSLASKAGIGVGVDLFACWFDSDIYQAIRAAAGHIALVQVSDYVKGDRSLPCRAVPGDGSVPLERLLPAIHQTGFRGCYDLEVIGPRLGREGSHAGLARGLEYLASIFRATV